MVQFQDSVVSFAEISMPEDTSALDVRVGNSGRKSLDGTVNKIARSLETAKEIVGPSDNPSR